MKTTERKCVYEAPQCKRVVVELESAICAASTINPANDVAKDRHVTINEQNYESIDFTESGQGWD